MSQLQRDLDAIAAFEAAFASGEYVPCPTCGMPVLASAGGHEAIAGVWHSLGGVK